MAGELKRLTQNETKKKNEVNVLSSRIMHDY